MGRFLLAFGLALLRKKIFSTETKGLMIIGGGAKNSLWLTIFANVFNSKIVAFQQRFQPIHGGMMLAILSKGGSLDFQEGKYKEYDTSPELKTHYTNKQKEFEKFLEMYNQL